MNNNRLTGTVPDQITAMTGVGIIFTINNNFLDRDLNNNAIFSPVVQSWWNGVTAYLNNT